MRPKWQSISDKNGKRVPMRKSIAVLLISMMIVICTACARVPDEGADSSISLTSSTIFESTSDTASGKEASEAPSENSAAVKTTSTGREMAGISASNLDSGNEITAFPEKKSSSVLPEIEVTKQIVNLNHEGSEVFNGDYYKIVLKEKDAKAYPELDGAIRYACEGISEEVENAMISSAPYIADNGYEEPTYTHNAELFITRADRKAVSFCISCDSYLGGAHPYHYFNSFNFDTKTGEEILSDAVVKDMDACTEAIVSEIFKEEEFKDVDRQALVDSVRENVSLSSLPFGLGEDALTVYLSDYWLGSYALGWHVVKLPYDEYADLFNEEYIRTDEDMDLTAQVSYQPQEEKRHDISEYLTEDFGYTPHEDELFIVENPGWKRYVSGGAHSGGYETTLTKVSEESYLYAEDWLTSYNMSIPVLGRYAYGYTYIPYPEYPATQITLRDEEGNDKTFDFSQFVTAPDINYSDPFSDMTDEYIHYALEDGGVLYVNIGHSTYAGAAPSTGYMIAVDMDDGSVLWMSDPQVANGKSFAKIYDNIVCGYGFTDEPDYIYILDAGDGHTVNRMSVKTAPSYFTLLGSYLYVACYDTGYVFRYQ